MSAKQRAQLAITDETRQEGSTAMTVEPSKEGFAWSKKTRTLAAGLLVAGMMAALSLVPAPPARAATTLEVNSTGDFHDTITADGFCGFGGSCSLRAAIEEANSSPGADTINFAIPGTGVKTIVVNATGLGALPDIKEQVTINGYTQTGASPNTLAVGNDAALKIELDGTNVANSGLEISGSSGSVIKGLIINRFGANGIQIFGDSLGNRIEGDFIGTDPTGTLDRGNHSTGVSAFSDGGVTSETVVGGTTPATRNLISGNGGAGVELGNSNFNGVQPGDNRVQGNYIGTDKSGTKDLGNDSDAIFLSDTSANTIGGKTAASRNVVSGNAGGLDFFDTSDTQILGNRIGTTASGKGALGNDLYGVYIDGSFDLGSNNALGDGTSGGSNTIAFNGGDGGGDGVVIEGESTSNAISRNSIFSNAGLGIDLADDGPTPNDFGDSDAGPNGLQNKPVLSSAKTVSATTTIKGELHAGHQDFDYLIEFYSNPSGTNEGKKFIGEKIVKTDGNRNATFTFSPASKVALGQNITATAADASSNNTSEFSAPKKVASS
jgi:hypothetical protein